MNRVHSEAAAAAKEQRKNDKREKRKKHKDAKEDDCGASMAEEEAPKEKKQKQKQRKDKDEREEKKKLKPTVSIAVAGSIIDNAQSLELATLLAGQIARAATVFRIDEVVVFDSTPAAENGSAGDGEESGARFLVRILEYLETPQYLRRRLFPMHKNLKFVGLLPPLDAPHHVRKHEWSEFREGVTLESDPSKGTLVDVGLSKNVLVEQKLEPGKRVTVAMGTNRDLTTACIRKVVPPSTPREQMGSYWGYKVRYTSNLSGVLKNSPFKEEYDHIIGTSEHGQIVNSSELTLPTFRHLLIAFGGLAGLEESIEEDTNLKGKRADDVFTSYFNTCPNQGSRTIRTEEALLISLQYFQDPIRRAEQKL
ncbi:RNA methyltransferase [Zea mays]|uniref:RNA methyltransferase n=1 Tax=Zea mays TaxID=4577 RepID=A0A804QYZ1_MAIZE|nr:RNA methyltransferase [Zea mays]